MSSLNIVHQTPPYISKLPPEIFALVVQLVADFEKPRPPRSLHEETFVGLQSSSLPWSLVSQGGSLGWIRLAHVCRDWRIRICEGMPLLWAQYVGSLPAACEEMLRRAGETAPLDVQLGYNHLIYTGEKYSEPNFDVIALKALDRVRSFRTVDVRTSEFHAPIPPDLYEAPNLEHIEAHYLDMDYGKLEEDWFTHPNTGILRTSLLRSARFTNCFIPWICHGLTHLCLVLEDIGLPYNVLQDVLTRISDTIEELDFNMCIPRVFRLQTPIPHSFPKLRSMNIREIDELIGIFLQQISLPPAVLLNLTFVPYDLRWQIALRRLVADIFRRITSSVNFGTLNVNLIEREGSSSKSAIQLNLSEIDSCCLSPSKSYPYPCLVLSVERSRSDDVDEALSVMLEEIKALDNPLQTVQYLDIDLPLWCYDQEAITALSCLPRMRRLRIVDPLAGNSLSNGYIPMLPVRTSTSESTGHLEHLCILQTIDLSMYSLSGLCDTLHDTLESALRIANRRDPPLASLRLEIVDESGTLPDDTDQVFTAKFAKFANNFELDVKHGPLRASP